MNDRFIASITALVAVLVVATAAFRLSAREQVSPESSPSLINAIFAGGCFWSMERVFDELAGVASVTVGYTGGSAKNPSYELVELAITGHAESVQVVYDPKVIRYAELLDVYWRNTDPTDGGGQFCDRGTQYRPIIFYNDDAQKQAAEGSKKALEDSRRFKRILTQILPASTFWRAEAHHQGFYKTHPFEYRIYQVGCGRDARLLDLWGKGRRQPSESSR
jgi:peptide-methionine (S)-S-oxide reductase